MRLCYQALPRPVDKQIRRLSRVLNGVVRGRESAVEVLLAPELVSLSSVGVSEFVQEEYKWPKAVIRSELGESNQFTDQGFSLAYFDGAIVAGDGRAFDSRHRLIEESLATHDYQAINPGRWAHDVSREVSGTALALNWWSGNSNLYHWLRDVFPRAFALSALSNHPITLIVPAGLKPFQRHGIEALVRKFPLIKVLDIGHGDKYRTEHLIQPCLNPYVRGNGYLRPELVNFVRSTYLDGVPVGELVDVAYISRSTVGSRRLLDEQDVLARVQSEFEVQILAIEQLPFLEQLRVMSGVRVLTGVYGAGLVHLLFTRQEGLLELHNGDSKETHFSTLSVGCDSPYMMVRGGPADDLQDFRLGVQGTKELISALSEMRSSL